MCQAEVDVVEVVVLREGDDQKHLNKILDKLASAQKVKAKFIAKKRCTLGINGKIKDILEVYKFYKEAYGL